MVIFRGRRINNGKNIKKKLVGQRRIFLEKPTGWFWKFTNRNENKWQRELLQVCFSDQILIRRQSNHFLRFPWPCWMAVYWFYNAEVHVSKPFGKSSGPIFLAYFKTTRKKEEIGADKHKIKIFYVFRCSLVRLQMCVYRHLFVDTSCSHGVYLRLSAPICTYLFDKCR